jgi:hypothetical protein
VRVPREMVDEYLALCPPDVHLADRTGAGRTINATSAPAIWSCPGKNIHEKNSVRLFLADDMARMTRLLDKLENLDGVFGMAMEDVAQEMMKPSDTLSLGETEHKELQEIADWFSKYKKQAGLTPTRILCRFPMAPRARAGLPGPEPFLSDAETARSPPIPTRGPTRDGKSNRDKSDPRCRVRRPH